MAKAHKEKEKLDLSNKFDYTGRSLLDIENEKRAIQESKQAMMREIKVKVNQAYQQGTLVKENFFFIHVNILCEVRFTIWNSKFRILFKILSLI